MSPDLDALLVRRYPRLFAQRHLSPQESSMAWGFQCGNGWYWLIDAFCCEVQRLIDQQDVAPLVVTQVKSKLGSLRIHVRGGDERIHALTDLMRVLSERVDETSGQPHGTP